MEYLCFVRKMYELVWIKLQFTESKYTCYPDETECYYTTMACKLITLGVQNKVSISEKEVW